MIPWLLWVARSALLSKGNSKVQVTSRRLQGLPNSRDRSKNLSEEQKRALQEQIARKQRQVLHREKPSNIPCPVLVVARCGGMFMLMMVVDDAKDGGAEKEIDPLDDSEGKESGQDFKSYVVNEIIDDVVEETFFSIVELKHKLCQELLEEALETVLMGHVSPKK